VSDTPRTDACERGFTADTSRHPQYRLTELCRQLERELAEAKEYARKWQAENAANLSNFERAVEVGYKLAEQRDQARTAATNLRDAYEPGEVLSWEVANLKGDPPCA
jgi:uncharacterized protein YijF (DUF1287 family)